MYKHKKRQKSCHAGPIEVITNLFCGGEVEAPAMSSRPILVDTLVPLLDLDIPVWNSKYRGEILYCPIDDYRTLPTDVLHDLVSEILDRLNRGNKVGLFCMGGHGRTGYVASVVLGKLGYEDPIGYLRTKYCQKAVESNAQIEHIAEVLEKPELIEKYGFQSMFDNLDDFLFDFSDFYGIDAGYFSKSREIATCGDCSRFIAGICQKYKVFVDKYDYGCDEFIMR